MFFKIKYKLKNKKNIFMSFISIKFIIFIHEIILAIEMITNMYKSLCLIIQFLFDLILKIYFV